MTLQILLNLLIGLVWMLLHDLWDAGTFTVGFFLGGVIIFLTRRFFPTPFYGKKLWAILILFYLFIRELIKSTVVVMKQVTKPKLTIEPGIFRMQTTLKSEWEITLLSTLITLTPGSVVMEVAPDEGRIYVHAMDATEFKESIMKTKKVFEDAISEVTS